MDKLASNAPSEELKKKKKREHEKKDQSKHKNELHDIISGNI